jgi:hypothetical protein
MRLAALVLLLFSMVSSEEAAAQNYSEGQVWQYKTRPGEAGSLLRISKIETHPKLGPVFHIGVVGVRVRNPLAKTGFTSELPHFPVSKATLDKSVTTLSRTKPVFPDFKEGYAEWQRANGGVFTISVAEIVSVVEEAVQSGSKK